MACHLSAVVGTLFGAGSLGWVGPLVIWLIKKDQFPLVNDQGKEALNFQISMFAYGIALLVATLASCGVLVFVTVPLLVVLSVAAIVLNIIASMAANEGKAYRYPMTFRLIT